MSEIKLSEIKALWDKATPGDWTVRVHPKKDDFFVEAPAVEGEAYGTEILGDEDYPTKRADAEAIVKAKAHHPHLLELVKRLGKILDGLVFRYHCDHHGDLEDCHFHKCREGRALLKELKK